MIINKLQQHIKICMSFTNVMLQKDTRHQKPEKKVYAIWFNLHKIQNQAKLIYAVRSQDSVYPLGRDKWLRNEEDKCF